MPPLQSFFDRIYCLTLRRRKDRRTSAEAVFEYLDIPSSSIEWVYGPDRPLDHTGKPNGNQGCTAGHRMILDAIISSPDWNNGEYARQPSGLTAALDILMIMSSSPLQMQ